MEEEKRRILEQKEEMEKSTDEIREGFNKKRALLEVPTVDRRAFAPSRRTFISSSVRVVRVRGAQTTPIGHPYRDVFYYYDPRTAVRLSLSRNNFTAPVVLLKS